MWMDGKERVMSVDGWGGRRGGRNASHYFSPDILDLASVWFQMYTIQFLTSLGPWPVYVPCTYMQLVLCAVTL